MYNVIATGSDGNAVLYNNSILVDCGVPFSKIKPNLYDIQLVLLTHEHKDHINIHALRKLSTDRPTLRIGCCVHMLPFLDGFKNVDVYKFGEIYNYGTFIISPVKLYHDVSNCGYRIFICDGKGQEYKIFHATDTAHLEGITAKDYDLYAIEHNYNEETIGDIISEKEHIGQFSYEKGAINAHLSEQAARDFIFNNKKENSKILRLHESKNN